MRAKAFSLDVAGHFIAPAAGDTLTFSATLPVGLSINAHTGVISGIPTDSDFGNNTITVTATDAHGKAISESFHLAGWRQRADRDCYRRPECLMRASPSRSISPSHFTAPAAGDTLTFSA